MRPGRLVAVVGTATEVGKTWTTAAVARELRAQGHTVAARKPAQSFDPGDALPTDAEVLAAATGESPRAVCPAHRDYPVAMAPPMAAEVLGRERIALDELLREITWPAVAVECGFVETVGGVRSPVAHDGDSADLAQRLEPDVVLLVGDAALGTINAIRLSAAALAPLPVIVFLNRFDRNDDLHSRNREWLAERDGFAVATSVSDLVVLLLPK